MKYSIICLLNRHLLIAQTNYADTAEAICNLYNDRTRKLNKGEPYKIFFTSELAPSYLATLEGTDHAPTHNEERED